ncbi:hypothetical protein B4U80_05849 [Leptotrombidium deliense]|uniref:Uncharacterized protein n=1 Tax=Leptotrombidium deliense TaxID=299467 RepID=A0A443SDZ5_9ACAR|nr:hypothetical protein B4U80_05849 [Leptotrombidium deliense]
MTPNETFPTPAFKTGDMVRILLDKQLFRKGYKRKWGDDVYQISNIINRPTSVMYELKNHRGILDRRYYESEIQPKPDYQIRRIERILGTRRRNRKTEKLIKFKGNSTDKKWISLKVLNQLQKTI